MATATSTTTHEHPSHGIGWLFRHPVFDAGALLGIVFYGLTYGFFQKAVPQLIGLPGFTVLIGFLWIAVCMALMLESGRDPATRT